MTSKPVEILAPCGSFDIMKAAIASGADACYFGGSRFGARAFADNFTTEEILAAIDYAHLHGCRSYLTVNTLIKESEFADLYEDLTPCVREGLDAVIVQDLGVFRFLSREFPDLPIHVSTQMSISSCEGAGLMKRLGATRVVPARELTLKQISEIKQKTDIELEVFCHGAMCYSMSGRCLMSSLAGGRSGNRGRCAQTCRKCYDGSYLLSMKDMCTLEILPEILATGIDSLKIEGRMKNRLYVASAVAAYRDSVDEIIAGEFDIKKQHQRKDKLAEVFHRGGFCTGYYEGIGHDLTTKDRPGHAGVLLGEIVSIDSGKINVLLKRDLSAGDILEITVKGGENLRITSGVSGSKGNTAVLSAPKTKLMKHGMQVLLMQSSETSRKITEQITIGTHAKIPLSVHFSGKIGAFPTLTLRPIKDALAGFLGTASGENRLEESRKESDIEKTLSEKLFAFGGTDYIPETISVDYDVNVFLPGSVLKKLRRDAIASLEESILSSNRRSLDGEAEPKQTCLTERNERLRDGTAVSVTTAEQLSAVLASDTEPMYLLMDEDLIKSCETMLHGLSKHTALVMVLPDVINNSNAGPVDLPNPKISGIYINNPDNLARIALYGVAPQITEVMVGGFLYSFNTEAIRMVKELLSKLSVHVILEAPRELSVKELQALDLPHSMFSVYGYEPVMITRQCVRKSSGRCDHTPGVTDISDEKGNTYHVISHCASEYSVILNGVPLAVTREQMPLSGIRLYTFTIENEEETAHILSGQFPDNRTGGHYHRGVE